MTPLKPSRDARYQCWKESLALVHLCLRVFFRPFFPYRTVMLAQPKILERVRNMRFIALYKTHVALRRKCFIPSIFFDLKFHTVSLLSYCQFQNLSYLLPTRQYDTVSNCNNLLLPLDKALCFCSPASHMHFVKNA